MIFSSAGLRRVVATTVALALAFAAGGEPPSTVPPEGLRENTPSTHALVNARLVLAPGKTVERGTLVLRDGVILAVGPSTEVKPPADARVWDLAGRTVYPGLIDAYGELSDGSPRPPTGGASTGGGRELLRDTGSTSSGPTGAAHWNPRVAAQFRVDLEYRPDAATNRALRGQGIVARLVAPPRNIIRGTSAAVTTADEGGSRVILRPVVAMHAQLTPGGAPGAERGFPVSPMGAVALVRQAMLDAQWYGKARAAWEADPTLPRPEANDALAALQPVIAGSLPIVIDAPDEQYALRADRLAREFKLDLVLRGSGQEYRRLGEISATGRAVLVPVNFARPPNVASAESAQSYSVEELLDWDLQPENPARMHKSGVKFALTSHGLRDKGGFLAAVRKAVARGLPAEAALRAVTVTPADLLGLTRSHGTIEPGKAASLLVTDGELFDEKTKVLETWVDGTRHEIVAVPKEDVRGTWAMKMGEGGRTLAVRLTGDAARPTGRLVSAGGATRPATRPAGRPRGRGGAGGEGDLANLTFAASRITFTMKEEGRDAKGVVQVSAVVSGDEWLGAGVRPDGSRFVVTATRTAPYDPKSDADRDAADSSDGPTTRPAEGGAAPRERVEPPPGEREQPTTRVSTPEVAEGGPATQPVSPALERQAEKASTQPALFDVRYPLSGFGRAREPEQPAAVLFKDATVWTSGPRGKLAKASVLVENGKITAVFADGEAAPPVPAGAVVVDCAGKHLAPGIIDCHSHIATDGGVNESSQSITCEVRIGDFIDPDDVNIYRQLAGGVTAANVLHGSANTIGGQNQVIKFRWGASSEGLKFKEAPAGVKFALGENVKRSNFTGERGAAARYPMSRMGVEQLVRDAFAAARDYQRQWQQYKATGKGVPPRVDLELEALLEIVEGKRLVHCHSYRQDEILALLRTCEQFGVRVATFQHVLEGYKVADAIGRHGAGGSAFADWWAYKYEAFDAIPYGGALMHNAGVLVSFNSDDAELARRLNTEAAKAVKYGGVPEEEALKFVTLNPAKQLRIDAHVGSIEPGKHADLVVWSGPPLSTLSRAEQTWVDGRRYFDREEDRKLRETAQQMRVALVQKILAGGERMSEGDEAEPRPRDVWRHSEDCRAGDCCGMLRR